MSKENKNVTLYDTTLRDGTQAEDISFSVEDKVRVTHALDNLGLHYIEGGWPGSNPRDIEFFKKIKGHKLKNSVITAFGATRRKGVVCSRDPSLRAMLRCGSQAVTIFGKSWKLHVTKALRVSLAENLDMINESVLYLNKRVDTVFYDAEHFFDGYKDDPAYALKTLAAALDAEARVLVLCDTNGGTLPHEVSRIVGEVRKTFPDVMIGIHAHNDSESAVANSLVAVHAGARHVQGTINGIGERCGNADLISIIPALGLKMALKGIEPQSMRLLGETSRFVLELANLPHRKHQPYVGVSAFAHKAGIHVNAIVKTPQTYEHIDPTLVGNRQRILVSDLSGRSNILCKAREYGIELNAGDPATKRLLKKLKRLEHQGFQFEGAEASFELMMQKALGRREDYFTLLGYRVIEEKQKGAKPSTEASIRLAVEGEVEHTAAEGNGPVNALDRALRKALERFYPSLKQVRLIDFKVRVIDAGDGTASVVRVLVESGDDTDKWGTVGVSENVIEASWQAITDSLVYKLYKDKRKRASAG